MVSNFDKTNHSVYKLTYHLVLVVKYRRKVITEPIFESLINIFNRVGSNYRIMVVEANFEADHITHIV
ncbi:transposase [Methanobrevibacter sp.]|uniref:transposase n=1 Tax=Methanobrevibacter sp. TaxID=66852 RepID=UPI0038673147